MKKRISLLSIVLIGLTSFLFACTKPHVNLKLTVSETSVKLFLPLNNDPNNLDGELEEGAEESGFDFSRHVTATVSGSKGKTKTDVSFMQSGSNAVTIDNIQKVGDTTSFVLTAKNPGESIITILTLEGGLTHRINVQVYRRLESIDFTSATLAIKSAETMQLKDHTKFNPSETNQKDVNYFIVHPNYTGQSVTDSLGNIIETEYAKITDGQLTIKNQSLAPQDLISRYNYVEVQGYSDFDNEIKTSVKKIAILNLIDEDEIELRVDNDGEKLRLRPNINNEYEIVLASNKSGNTSSNLGLFKRRLEFKIGNTILVDKNYGVSYEYLSNEPRDVVNIIDNTNYEYRNSNLENNTNFDELRNPYINFNIEQLKTGETVAVFKVDYKNFMGQFTKLIKVRIKVVAFPTVITAVDAFGGVVNETSLIEVFNQYGKNSFGTMLRFTAEPSIQNLTYTVKAINTNNLVVKNQTGLELDLMRDKVVNGQAIYLSHNLSESLPENARVLISFDYSLSPTGSINDGYKVYSETIEIPLVFKIGLSEITVPANMLINTANKTLIDSVTGAPTKEIVLVSINNSNINLIESIKSIEIISFNGVLTQNIPGFNMSAYTNEYFELNSTVGENKIFLTPNNQGKVARFKLRITTNNGIISESEINLFVPLVYQENGQLNIISDRSHASLFESEYEGYNLSIDEEGYISVKLSRDSQGNYYDSNGVMITEDSETTALSTTYETLKGINIKTHSTIEFGFRNFISTETQNGFEILAINSINDVQISDFSNDYMSFEKDTEKGVFVLKTKGLTTSNYSRSFRVNYSGYGIDGKYKIMSTVVFVNITAPLQSISLTPKSATLYEKGSVGVLHENKSIVNISINTNNNIVLLDNPSFNVEFIMANNTVYNYGIKIDPSTYVEEDGQVIRFIDYIKDYIIFDAPYITITNDGFVNVMFTTADIAHLVQNGVTASVQASISESYNKKIEEIFKLHKGIALKTSLNNVSYIRAEFEDIKRQVTNMVFATNIRVKVYASVTQYNSQAIYAEAEYEVKHAQKVENIILYEVSEKGIYFDTRKVSEKTRKVVVYALPKNATHNTLIARISNINVARIISGVNELGEITGDSIVIESLRAGETTLIISAKDDYRRLTVNGQEEFVAGKNREVRIKVADGSELYPFEIYTASDFDDIRNYSANFHYVIARDINLTNIDFKPFNNFNGGLSGKFTFFNDGVYETIQNTIYSLSINQTLNINNSASGEYSDYNIGLFNKLGTNAKVSDLILKAAILNVNIDKKTSSVNETIYDKNINIGILAGQNSSNLTNIFVEGMINVNSNIRNINAGGIVGLQLSSYNAVDNILTGQIKNDFVSNSLVTNITNSEVGLIIVTPRELDNEDDLTIGGIAGKIITTETSGKDLFVGQMYYDNKFVLNDLTSYSLILSYYKYLDDYNILNSGYLGGIVGYAENSTINNVSSSSMIRGYSNVGGIVGFAENTYLSNSSVLLYDQGFEGEGQTHFIATTNLGGLVGAGKSLHIEYSYVRNFMGTPNTPSAFYDNFMLFSQENNYSNDNYVVGGLVGMLYDSEIVSSIYANLATGQLYESVDKPNSSLITLEKRVSSSSIKTSYFNANINNSYTNIRGYIFAGGLVGFVNHNSENKTLSIENSYVLGNILQKEEVEVNETQIEIDSEDVQNVLGTTITKEIETRYDSNAINIGTENNSNVLVTLLTVVDNLREVTDQNGTVLIADQKVTRTDLQLAGIFVGNEEFSVVNNQINTVYEVHVFDADNNALGIEFIVSLTEPVLSDFTDIYPTADKVVTIEMSKNYEYVYTSKNNDTLLTHSYSMINFDTQLNNKSFVYENSVNSELNIKWLTENYSYIENYENETKILTDLENNFMGYEISDFEANGMRFADSKSKAGLSNIKIYDTNDILIDEFDEMKVYYEDLLSVYTNMKYFTSEKYAWYAYENLNSDMPLLIDSSADNLLYLTIPSSITVMVVEGLLSDVGFTNQDFIRVSDEKVVLFYNNLISGHNPSFNNKYQVLQIFETLNNQNIKQFLEVNLNINLNDDMIFQPSVSRQIIITSDNQSILKVLDNGVVETLNTGQVKLRVALKLNPSIYTEIDVLVVNGISGFGLISEDSFAQQDIYIDSINYYIIESENVFKNTAYFAEYVKNQNVGYLVSLNELTTGAIELNGILLEPGKVYAFDEMREFNVKGINMGSVVIDITPYIKTTFGLFGQTILADNKTVNNAILINKLSKERFLTLNVMQKASNIATENKTNVKISPLETTEILGSVTTSAFDLNNYQMIKDIINKENFSLAIKEEVSVTIFDARSNKKLFMLTNLFEGASSEFVIYDEKYLLITGFDFERIAIEEVLDSTGKIIELKISFAITVSFDGDKFKQASKGQTYNLNEQNYVLTLTPKTNNAISASVGIDILPNQVNRITTTFYAGNEYKQQGQESVFNPQESSTTYIAPGKVGLMKMYLFPEFNDAEYVELSVGDEFKSVVSFEQMIEVYRDSEYSSVTGYARTGYNSVVLPGNNGVRLRNLSLVEHQGMGEKLFNGSYFARVSLSSAAREGDIITFTATAFKTVNGVQTRIKDQIISLTVQPLPRVNISYQGDSAGIANAGSVIALDVEAFNYDGEVTVTREVQKGDILTTDIKWDAVSGKYLLTIKDNATIGDIITVTVRANKIINDMEENASASVQIKIVDYIVKGIYLDGISSAISNRNTFEILNGTSNELSVILNANYSKTAMNGSLIPNKLLLENIIGGKNIATNNSLLNNWYIKGSDQTYEKLNENNLNYFDTFKFSRVTGIDIQRSTYYAISGLKVNNGQYTLGVKFNYYYDQNGRMQIFTGSESDIVDFKDSFGNMIPVYSTEMYEFTLVILDNSTYDHPNPINTIEEFYAMQPGVHYILTSDIVLEDYVPFNAEFASLDGNGYVIKVNSFNTDKYVSKDGSTVNNFVGIFETVSRETLIKNITINISALLENKAFINTAIASQGNANRAMTKIDLTRTANITFGMLAGMNSGTITNARVINLDNSMANIENKLLFINTLQSNVSGMQSNARIGALVGQNNGSISNSFVGLNYNSLSQTNDKESKVYRVINGGLTSQLTYNFGIAGGKQIAGFVHTNSGSISNSYNKEVSVINISPIADQTNTAGFVAVNTGTIYGSFIEGANINKFRSDNSVYIEAKGNIGGFVYQNAGKITESYSNITIKTNSGRSGGFVYQNTGSGLIQNAYSSGYNGASNSTAHGMFTGVNEKSEYNNAGVMQSVFYLRYTSETENENEPATSILGADDVSSDGNPFRYEGSFNEFSFISDNQTENGIWLMNTNNSNIGPQLVSSYYFDTLSFRKLDSKQVDPNNPEFVIHNYSYDQNTQLGTRNNPYLVSTADEFLNIILSTSRTYTHRDGKSAITVFGMSNGNIRLVNNLNFANIDLNKVIVRNKKISDIIFAGVLDGNGMSMNGLSLLDENKDRITENYGFFNQIGLSNKQYDEYVKLDITNKHSNVNPTIKNLNITIGSFEATNSVKVGALAGSIYDSNLININMSSSRNVVITGRNLVGAFAGLIKFEKNALTENRDLTNESVVVNDENSLSKFTITGLHTDGVSVTASYSETSVLSSHEVNRYGVAIRTFGMQQSAAIFNTYALLGNKNDYQFLQTLSYAGSIAGVLQGANRTSYDINIKQTIDEVVYTTVSGDTMTIVSNKFGASVQEIKFANKDVNSTGVIATGTRLVIPNINKSVYEDINQHRSKTNSKISDLKVTGGGIIRAENVGGLFGFIGKETHIKKAVYEITSSIDMPYGLYGFNYAGGIVGENYGMLEKVYVQHEKENQDNYDSRTNEGDSEAKGSQTLFVQRSSPNVSVAIGGIAGYVDGAIILDSFVKVNVVNANAKIAGGIVGLATRKNYISHSYIVGDVYASSVVGGIFGLYNQAGNGIIVNRGDVLPTDYASNAKLLLDYVVGLNTWGAATKQSVSENIRDYYIKSGISSEIAHYNFKNILSEVGNLAPNITKLSDLANVNQNNGLTDAEKQKYNTLINSLPVSSTQFKFIGSLGGRITLGTQNGQSVSALNRGFVTEVGVNNAVPKSRMAQDVVNTNYESTVSTVSFSERNVLLSGVEQTNIWPHTADQSALGDIIGYPNVVGTQYTFRQLIGSEINYKNQFNKWVNDEVSASKPNTNSFSQVWRTTIGNKLPHYIVGIYSNYEIISTNEEMIELLNNANTQNQYYILQPNKNTTDGVYNINALNLSGSNVFNNTFSGVLIGQNLGLIKPKIVVEFGKDIAYSSIFKNLNSATIANIDFEIKVNGESSGVKNIANNDRAGEISKNFGLFARDVVSANISDVVITLTTDITPTGQNQKGIKFVLPANTTNFGVVFGSVHNSLVADMQVDIKFNSEIGANDNAIYTNISAFAASISDTDLRDIDIYGNNYSLKVTAKNTAIKELSVSGFVGTVYNQTKNSTMRYINNNVGKDANKNYQVIVESTTANVILYGAGLVSRGYNFALEDANYLGNLTFGSGTGVINGVSYIGGIVGYISDISTINNIFFNSYYEIIKNATLTSYNYKPVFNTGNQKNVLNVNTSHNAHIGGLIGYVRNSTIKSESGLMDSANEELTINNSADINVVVSGNKRSLYIGGIIGEFVTASQNRLYKAFNAGDIKVTRGLAPNSDANIYLGGIIGSSNRAKLERVYNYGDISFNTNSSNTTHAFSVGGIVGELKSSTELSDFISLGDINYLGDKDFALSNVIGGVYGKAVSNTVSISMINGYSLARLFKNNISVSKPENANILGNSANVSESKGVYWIYEFAPSSTSTAGRFISYLNISGLNSTEKVNMKFAGINVDDANSSLPMGKKLGDNFNYVAGALPPQIKGITGYEKLDNLFDKKLTKVGGKLNPVINPQLSNLNNSSEYAIIKTIDITYSQSSVKNFNGFLIGSSDVLNSAFITINYYLANELFETNNGIIANILINNKNTLFAKNTAYFAKNNKGVLINTSVTGQINDNINTEMHGAGIVFSNSGLLINSSAVLTYLGKYENNALNYGAIAYENSGVIDASYSNTVFIGDDNKFNISGIAFMNDGNITDSYFGGYFVNSNNLNALAVLVNTNSSKGKVLNSRYDFNNILTKESINNTYASYSGAMKSQSGDIVSAKNKKFIASTSNTLNYGYPYIINGPRINTAFNVVFESQDYNSANHYNVSALTSLKERTFESYIPIFTPYQFANMSEKDNDVKGYILLSDISFAGYKKDANHTAGVVDMASGTLTINIIGNNKKVSGLKVNGALFEKINYSTIANLTFENVVVDNNINTNNSAIIAKEMRSVKLKNVNIYDSIVIGGNNTGMIAGTFDGAESGKVSDILISGNKNITVNDMANYKFGVKGGENTGLLFGTVKGQASNYLNIRNIKANHMSVMTIEQSKQIGGLFGYGTYLSVSDVNVDKLNINSLAITFNNSLRVNAAKQVNSVGGVAGYSTNSTYDRATTNSRVMGYSAVGGLFGSGDKLNISYSGDNSTASFNPLTAPTRYVTGSEFVGGIIGIAENSKINQAVSYSLTTVNNNAKNIGGIAGKIKSSDITNSRIVTNITAIENAGGIVGYSEGVSVIRNTYTLGKINSTNTNEMSKVQDNGSRNNFYIGANQNHDQSDGGRFGNTYLGMRNHVFEDTMLDNRKMVLGRASGNYGTLSNSTISTITIPFGIVVGKNDGLLTVDSSGVDVSLSSTADFEILGLIDYTTSYDYSATGFYKVEVRVTTLKDTYKISARSYGANQYNRFNIGGSDMNITHGNSFVSSDKFGGYDNKLHFTHHYTKRLRLTRGDINKGKFSFSWSA